MFQQSYYTMGLLCVFLLLAFSPGAIADRIWHVSKKELPGIKEDEQVRTINKAVSLVEPGDTVIIHNGIYREEVVIEKSGLPDKPIKFQAAVGENVTVTGADRITDWREEDSNGNIYSVTWPHKFVAWNADYTHPNDDYHLLIGRCEQVFVNRYSLRQVLSFDKLSRGTFFADMEGQRLYVWSADNSKLSDGKQLVEASVRNEIWVSKGDYISVKGIRFRYAANHAQRGAAIFSGDHNTIENCVFEDTNASGATFTGQNIVVRGCAFQNNGQMGFGAGRAHNLLMTNCTIRNNNTKGYNRGWEAGGNKIAMTRGAIIEKSVFAENRGNGIWFDIGNEDNEIRNCLFINNEDAGIFYEISYGLYAHDNVIVGNGFAHNPGAWGANAGISISSSPNCVIERNLIIGNKEGFSFREQGRSTPKIDNKEEEPVWNHDQIIRNNIIAYNRDAQIWGWFDINDNRHWPARDGKAEPDGLTLEKLSFIFRDNLYSINPPQELFNWGVTWKENRRYDKLDDVRDELDLEQGSKLVEFVFRDFSDLDFRVPADSPALEMGCYPKGSIPGVQLGIWDNGNIRRQP